jgi:hypothetical protein
MLFDVNSAPLSERMWSGMPRVMNKSVSEGSDFGAIDQPVGDKIVTPDMVRPAGTQLDAQPMVQPPYAELQAVVAQQLVD